MSGLLFEAESLTSAKAAASSGGAQAATISRDAESFGSFRYTWFAMDGRTEPCAEKGVTLLFKGRSALANVISVIPVRR